MACCGTAKLDYSPDTPLIFPVPMQEMVNFQNRAQKVVESAAPSLTGKSVDDYHVGAVTMPNGNPIYGATVADDKDAAFYTERGGYQIIVTLTADSDKWDFHAALIKDNNPIIEGKWEITASVTNSINPGGFISKLDVDIIDANQVTEVRGCFEDCIKRHAPKCVYICLNYGKHACIACAGGVIACCFVNCHC